MLDKARTHPAPQVKAKVTAKAKDDTLIRVNPTLVGNKN
jgi:hypothetical protein